MFQRSLLKESDITERNAFLRLFIKLIEIDKDKATVHYHLPLYVGIVPFLVDQRGSNKLYLALR